jgi:hypothetical protein
MGKEQRVFQKLESLFYLLLTLIFLSMEIIREIIKTMCRMWDVCFISIRDHL